MFVQRLRVVCICLCGVVFSSTAALGQTVIPYSANLTADGMQSAGELDGTMEVQVTGGHGSVTVNVAHDGDGLFCAFSGALQTQFQLPEVLIDPALHRSEEWLEDDVWIHVSGSDCFSIGEHSNYDDCEQEQPDWIGVPNLGQSGNVTYIEIYLPFDFLGVITGDFAGFGLAFDVTNTAGSYSFWPQTADIDRPSTWSTVILETTPTDVEDNTRGASGPAARILPDGTLELRGVAVDRGAVQLTLTDMRGRTLLRRELTEAAGSVDLTDQGLAAGAYVLALRRQTEVLLVRKLLYTP